MCISLQKNKRWLRLKPQGRDKPAVALVADNGRLIEAKAIAAPASCDPLNQSVVSGRDTPVTLWMAESDQNENNG